MSLSDILSPAKPAIGTPPFAPAPWEQTGGASPALPAKHGFAGFLDRFLEPQNALGRFGRALVMAGGTPLGDAYKYMDQSRANDFDEQMKRAQYQEAVRKARQPKLTQVGHQVGIQDQDTGMFTPTYTAPEDPSPLQRDRDYMNSVKPGMGDTYLDNRANPMMAVQGFDANGAPTLTFMPRSGSMPGAPVAPAPAAPAPPAARKPPAANLVPDAAGIIGQIYPGAHVTDSRRDPKSALGRANPGSYHNMTDRAPAADVRPIPGMTFGQYVQGFRDKGYDIVEARDEATHPLPHTTGPNWHVVLGGGPGAADATPHPSNKAEYDALPPGTVYVAPDGSRKKKS